MPTTAPRNSGCGGTSCITTPSGADACPACKSLDYTHPREFLKPGESKSDLAELLRQCPKGWCPDCSEWLLPKEDKHV